MPATLSATHVTEFIEHGVTVLRGGFSPEVAQRCREQLWTASGANADDARTWTKPVIHLQEAYGDGPFTEIMNPRLSGAFDDLLGPGRYVPLQSYGWWPISFPGFDHPPWTIPTIGWHVDGQHFHHHIDSSEQGLLPLFIFSEIRPGDGGTAYIPGSHRSTARILQDAAPHGIGALDVSRCAAAAADPAGAIEATGEPGDVLLLHPFMVHARSPNTGSRVRFICNPCVGLHERIRLDAGPDRSPLERSIIRALSSN